METNFRKKEALSPLKAFGFCVLGITLFFGGNLLLGKFYVWLLKTWAFSWVLKIPLVRYIVPISLSWATIHFPFVWGGTVATSKGGEYAGAVYGLVTMITCSLTLVGAIKANGFKFYAFLVIYLPYGVYTLHSVFLIVASISDVLNARRNKAKE